MSGIRPSITLKTNRQYRPSGKSITAILLIGVLFGGQTAFATDQEVKAPAFVTLDAIPVCYDFGCKNRSVVNLPLTDWQGVTGWFAPEAITPDQEREQIMRAIGWMEVLIGQHTPTHKDLAFDLPAQDDVSHLFPGQQDCIDEAVNTTTYLRLFEQSGLLKHHTVIEQAYRKAILDQHWAGQVKELVTGKRWVVDSWFQPNGYLPVIQASEEWEDINLLTAVVDDSREQKKPSFWKRLFRKE
ncbi:MAG: hypothetical protein GKR95_14350 [Gammaproteobacteria bacterium]|nr:hypothetical protein [Gammaproteobacteria bacterium]